ncbi:MAG TPA: CpaD family pilus assembly protein [Roseiarcus sp.]|nr:CpaD family pilus assembly protein [Roseiarcus sp.]
MSRNPTQRRLRALPFGWFLLASVAASPLAGCGVDYASNDGIDPGDYRQRHPIVLAQAPTTLDVYPVGGGLDSQAAASIRAFAERYRALGAGQIAILAPAGQRERSSRIIDEIRRTLASTGLHGYVGVGVYPADDPTRVSPVRLIFQGLKAVVRTPCGQWPSDLASGGSIEGWKNQAYPNFGCATQSVLAAQVADPRDLAQTRAIDPPDVNMRMRAIENVREGQDPGTSWKIQNTAIGQVGTGG